MTRTYIDNFIAASRYNEVSSFVEIFPADSLWRKLIKVLVYPQYQQQISKWWG